MFICPETLKDSYGTYVHKLEYDTWFLPYKYHQFFPKLSPKNINKGLFIYNFRYKKYSIVFDDVRCMMYVQRPQNIFKTNNYFMLIIKHHYMMMIWCMNKFRFLLLFYSLQQINSIYPPTKKYFHPV